MATARATQRREDDDVGGEDEARKLRRRIEYRRSRLLQDASEVSELFGPHLAILAIPAAGRPTLFGNPTVESVLRSFLPAANGADAETETADQAAARVAAMRREAGSIEARVAQEEARLRAVAEIVKAAQEEQGREHWWEVDVDALGDVELPEFAAALDVLRADVLRRLDKLAEAPNARQRR
jgi:flagellin-like hook-associated protein FlgL